MTEILLALVMQFGILQSDGVIKVNKNGIDQVKQQSGVDLRLVESDGNYRIIPTVAGVEIVEEDMDGIAHPGNHGAVGDFMRNNANYGNSGKGEWPESN